MRKTIEETTRLLLQGTLTKDEADKILLSLSNVMPSFPSDDDIQEEARARFPEPEGYTNENQFNFSWGAKYMKRACEKAFEKRGNKA
jgi:hypothetical protein